MMRPRPALGPEAATVWGQLRLAPNVVSAMRLALVPPFLAAYFAGAMHAAVLLFALAAVSDVVDGALARLLGQRTMVGALLHYITHCEPEHFQPMKAAMGLLPELPAHVRSKQKRYESYAERAAREMEAFLELMGEGRDTELHRGTRSYTEKSSGS